MLKVENEIKHEEIDLDSDLYPYHCKECSKKFQDIFEIKDHILIDHSLPKVKNKNSKIQPGRTKNNQIN